LMVGRALQSLLLEPLEYAKAPSNQMKRAVGL